MLMLRLHTHQLKEIGAEAALTPAPLPTGEG